MTTLLDMLEESGLPILCVAIAEPENQSRVLGEVLAEAVKVTIPCGCQSRCDLLALMFQAKSCRCLLPRRLSAAGE